MGGCCCCCSSKGTQLNTAPPYYYYPRASDERVPLSSNHGAAASTLSTGLLVDTNLDTSVPDAYRPPPAPIPFETAVGRPPSPQEVLRTCDDKNVGAANTENSDSVQEMDGAIAQETSPKCEDKKEVESKGLNDLEVDSVKGLEVELSKSVECFVPEIEDDCPICLEEYDVENPKITTKCEHHFHLACILEWMERSDACPVCDKEMIIDPPFE